MTDKPWEFDQPLCAEVGTEIFFVDDKDDPRPKMKVLPDYNSAKKICKSCVHRTECAEWGIKHEVFGVWGGLTPQERAIIRKSRRMNVQTLIVQI